MSIITPDKSIVSELSDIVDEVNEDYSKFIDFNKDEDDIDYLTDLLNEKTKKTTHSIEWVNYDDSRDNPDEWISAIAGATKSGNFITVILWTQNLETKWGPKTFKEMILKMLCHETIHFGQYDKIGFENLNGLESGHEKGKKLSEKTGNDRDWQRSYLRDPHELMAYGHDLATEINCTDNPVKTLRNPEAFIDDLPVYKLYRDIFPPNAKPLQKLLSYTARYLIND